MQTTFYGPDDFLEYNVQYKILICRTCRYAVQKNALESHLLRHKIYRSDRQQLLASISLLDLAEPDDVLLPVQVSAPVSSLPVLSGLRCTAHACQHLTASEKRMKRHWADSHEPIATPSSIAQTVKIQTFFRGTKNKYFEVATPTSSHASSCNDASDNSHHSSRDQDHDLDVTSENVVPQQDIPVSGSGQPIKSPSVNDHAMEVLVYFHHFTTKVSPTLPNVVSPGLCVSYWQTKFVTQAMQQRWMMCGLLAISAYHYMTVAGDTVSARHHKRATEFESEFSAGLELLVEDVQSIDHTEGSSDLIECGQRLKHLLRCIRWTVVESPTKFQLHSVIHAIRGCIGFSQTQDVRQEHRSESTTPATLLTRLTSLPYLIGDRVGRPKDGQDAIASVSALASLIKCCETGFASVDPAVVSMSAGSWLTDVPDHFNRMFSKSHPAAMVILAHWAIILLNRAELVGCWYLKGLPKAILLEVTTLLSKDSPAVLDLVEVVTGLIDVI